MLLFALALLAAASAEAPAQLSTAPAAASESAPLAGEVPVTAKSPEAAAIFRDGRRKAINWDCPSAVVLLKKSLALEPDFPLALAWLSKCELGPEGLVSIDRALKLGADLPLAERIEIDTLAAEKRGDDERVRKLRRRLADLAPNDVLAQLQLGVQSQYDHKSQAAIVHLKRAIELNPEMAEAYNYLGYVYAELGMSEEGVAAARKFTELRPQEANSHDSLAEVLLLVGRIPEAEAEFSRALELSPDFWMSSAGLAYARFYRGDFAGGRAAIAQARKLPHPESESRALALVDAWALLGDGHHEEALAALDVMEREATAKKSPLGAAWARFERAEMMFESDRFADAHAQIAAARQSLVEAGAGDEQNRIRRSLLVLDAILAAREEKPPAADKAVAALEEELRHSPSNTDVRSAFHHAKGEAALAAKDFTGAIESLSLCPDSELACRLDLIAAQEAAGQRGAADETRNRVLNHYIRDNLHRGEDPAALYFRLKLLRKPQTAISAVNPRR